MEKFFSPSLAQNLLGISVKNESVKDSEGSRYPLGNCTLVCKKHSDVKIDLRREYLHVIQI